MVVVIFRATLAKPDEEYFVTAQRLRELAFAEFGCLDFVSFNEADREIAVSYWPSAEAVRAWRDHPEHQAAQRLGSSRWYRDWQIEVATVTRQSRHP